MEKGTPLSLLVRIYNRYGEQHGGSLKELNIEPAYARAAPLLSTYPEELAQEGMLRNSASRCYHSPEEGEESARVCRIQSISY